MQRKDLIPLLDLTSLNDDDTEQTIIDLCRQAQTPLGNVAAVCVYPKFVATAYKQLKESTINIATVINFPDGNQDIEKIVADITTAIKQGATEVDLVTVKAL